MMGVSDRLIRWLLVAAVIVGFGSVIGVTKLRSQTGSALAISSPNSGAVYYPGQSIPVTVSTNASGTITWVTVIGTAPFGFYSSFSPPFSLNIPVPLTTMPGQYRLTAYGGTSNTSGVKFISRAIVINVETNKSVTSLKVQPTMMAFDYVGEQLPLNTLAVYSDGSMADVGGSSQTSYKSGSPSIASVDTSGVVTANGGGSTDILVQYNGQSYSISASVPNAIRADLNGDGIVNMDDLNILDAALNTPATKPHDARDLNGDGKIDALDARILVTLCTKSRCAY